MNEKGLNVPAAITANLNHWIKQVQERTISQPQDVSVIAYAHYLQAKKGHDAQFSFGRLEVAVGRFLLAARFLNFNPRLRGLRPFRHNVATSLFV